MSEITLSMRKLVSLFERGEINQEEYFKLRGELIDRSLQRFQKKHTKEALEIEKRNKAKKQVIVVMLFGIGILAVLSGVLILSD